jgi:ketosteroid isomerase-like protein
VWVSAEGSVLHGLDAIRGVFADFLALDAMYASGPARIAVGGDVALVCASWTVQGTEPGGEPVALAGRTADVLRRQADGSWRYLIDSPFGGASPDPATEGRPS